MEVKRIEEERELKNTYLTHVEIKRKKRKREKKDEVKTETKEERDEENTG